MKIVTSRDIKNNPNILFKEGQETIVTSRGKPRAVCIALDETDLEDIDLLLTSIRQARAKLSLERIRTDFGENKSAEGTPLNGNICDILEGIFKGEGDL